MSYTVSQEEGVGTFVSRGKQMHRGQVINVRNQDYEVVRKANTGFAPGFLYQVVPLNILS